MEGEDSDGGPLFDEDVYNLLREDSLVRRMGSYNFHQLVSSPSPQDELEEHQQQTQGQQHPYQYSSQVHYGPQIPIETAAPNAQPTQQLRLQQSPSQLQESSIQLQHPQNFSQLQQQEGHLQENPQQRFWDSIGTVNETLVPDANGVLKVEEVPPASDPVPVLNSVVPSLQPWSGRYNFKVSFITDNRDKNKWCFSEALKKLYVCPTIAVPMDLTVYPWVDALVRITPIYQQSQYLMEPVGRCYNCKNTRVCDVEIMEHLVQLESDCCQYEVLPDQRHVVTLPLSRPPPGERASTVLLKLMCMTSCVGGPNRRPFCLVITLHCKFTGREIGRQVINIKCCKCPQRDLNNEKGQVPREESTISNPAPVLEEEKSRKIRNLASQIKVGRKRKKPPTGEEFEMITKVEPDTEIGFVNIRVPVEIESAVKTYINGLMAAKLLGRNNPELLLYPEEEKDDTGRT